MKLPLSQRVIGTLPRLSLTQISLAIFALGFLLRLLFVLWQGALRADQLHGA